MVYPTPELEGGPVLEHGTTKSGRWLKANRVKIAIWIAASLQALVALIPILVIVVGTFALIAVGFIAVIALILLFTDRG